MPDAPIAFFSYSREDSDFALRLANDLRAAGSAVWIDQLDIGPGERWDRVVQSALENCPSVLVILSPASVNSNNVLDEVSFALDQNKTLIPVLYRECDIPFRLRRFQHVDFRGDYDRMLEELRKCLHIGQQPTPRQDAPVRESHPRVERHTPDRTVASAPYADPPASSPPQPSNAGRSFPDWAKLAILIAVVTVAVLLYMMRGKSKNDAQRASDAAGTSPVAVAVPAEPEVHTGLSPTQTNPPCSIPASSESVYSATDPAVWFFFAFKRADPTDQWAVRWIEPNGYVHKTDAVQHPSAAGRYCFEMKIAGTPAQNAPGEWAVRLSRNGSDLAERKFAIRR